MQLIHSITLTGVVLLSSASALFHYREKPLRDVAAVSGLLCAVSAAKLADPRYADQFKALSKGIWGYLSTL
jgi:hypothetical protein